MTRLGSTASRREVAAATIAELLAERGIDPRRGFSPSRSTAPWCAAPNGRPRRCRAGDDVEIVRPLQGG